MNDKQDRVKRPTTVDGMDVDEFIRRNADPIWLHQNEMWEDIDAEGFHEYGNQDDKPSHCEETENDMPF